MAYISEGQIQSLMDHSGMTYEEARTLLEMKFGQNDTAWILPALDANSPEGRKAIDAEQRRELDEADARLRELMSDVPDARLRELMSDVPFSISPSLGERLPMGTLYNAVDDNRPIINNPMGPIINFEGKDRQVAASVPEKSAPGRSFPAQESRSVRPRCPTHGERMRYDASEDRMLCAETECTMQAKKNYNFQDSVGAMPSERPAVYKGPIRVVFSGDGEPFLYLEDANAMVSIRMVVEGDDPTDPKALSRVVEPLSEADTKRRRAAREADRELRRREERLKAQQDAVDARSMEISNRRRPNGEGAGDVFNMVSRPRLFGHELPLHCGQEAVNDIRDALESMPMARRASARSLRVAYDAVFPTILDDGVNAEYEGYNGAGVKIVTLRAPSKQSGVSFILDIRELFEQYHPGTVNNQRDAVVYVMAYGIEVTRGNIDRVERAVHNLMLISDVNSYPHDPLDAGPMA